MQFKLLFLLAVFGVTSCASDTLSGTYMSALTGEECTPDFNDSSESALSAGETGKCLKFEGGAIGQEELSGGEGEHQVEFSGWTQKEDSPGDYVGFTLTSSIDEFFVKAGGEIHTGSGDSWTHPNGTTGPEAPGISFVAFCDEGFESTDDDEEEETESNDQSEGCDDNGCCEVEVVVD